jgi:glycosyltransferase 2 family protein
MRARLPAPAVSSSDVKRLRRLVGPLVLVVALVALVLTLRAQGQDARDALGRTDPAAVALSGAAVLAGLLASVQVWKRLLADLGSPLTQRQALHVFFVGQLGKYVPGTVFAMAAQMQVGRQYAVPRSRVASSWLLFMLVLVATGLLCGVVGLPLTNADVFDDYGVVLLALPVGLLCLAPPVLNRVLAWLLRRTRRPPLERPLTWQGVAVASGWAFLMWALYAVHLVVLAEPQDPEPGHRLPLLALGAFALAWAAGPFFVIAPAGAVVREAVLVLALAPALDAPRATAVAVVSRLLMALGDALWALAGWLLRPRGNRTDREDVATVAGVT